MTWPAFVLAMVAVAFPTSDYPLHGVVVDPQGARVPDATVSIRCGSEMRAQSTAQDGTFAILLVSDLPCELMVRHAAFEPAVRTVRRYGARVTIRLGLARLAEHVTVLAEQPRPSGLASAMLDQAAIERLGGDAEAVLRYARRRAGVMLDGGTVYIDGVRSTMPPSAGQLHELAVHGDSFSPEYGGSPGPRYELTTRVPERRWRFDAGTMPISAGSANPLTGATSRQRILRGSVSGPLVTPGAAFSTAVYLSRQGTPQPFRRAESQNRGFESLEDHRRSTYVSGAIHAGREKRRGVIRVQHAELTRSAALADVITQPDAAISMSSTQTEVTAALDIERDGATHRSTLQHAIARDRTGGGDARPAVHVLGISRSGGAAETVTAGEEHAWRLVHVSRSVRSKWLVGASAAASRRREASVSNSKGVVLSGNTQSVRIWFPARRFTAATVVDGSLFASARVWQRREWQVDTGARLDLQNGDGAALSPRVAASWRRDGWEVRTSGGWFTSAWTTEVVSIPQRFASQPMVYHVDSANAPPPPVHVASARSPSFSRPRDVMVATTVQKSIGLVRAGVEHVWRRGWSLYGSRRFPSDAGWMDVLEANRRLERHQIHARLGWQGKRHSFISHYEYISSHDDTDGSLSFAARYDDLRAEWARSTGVAKHHASAVLDLILPRSASVSLSGGWHDSVPMNIVTGEDREGSLLFLTRPSARRNSGLGPGFRSVDGHGRYPLAFRVFNRRVAFDVNVLATDLLGKRNYTALNGVQSSPFYRQPLGAFPGPALKIWISVRQ